MKKFDLYAVLKEVGFKEQKNKYGSDMLICELEKEITVAWYGAQKYSIRIEVTFSADHSVVTANYYEDGFKRPFKTKVHLNEKRALNAIIATAQNKGFEF